MSKIGIDEYHEKISRLIEQHSLEQAAHHCLYLLRQFPKMSSLYQMLGRIFLESENYPAALDVYLRLASCGPEVFLNHVTLSFIFEKLKLPRQAVFFEKYGYTLQPDFSEKQPHPSAPDTNIPQPTAETEFLFGTGKHHFNRKSYQEALRYFQKNAGQNSFLVNDFYLGMTYVKLSMPEKALAVFQDTLTRAPFLLSALRWIAAHYYQKNELCFTRALEKLIAIDPNYSDYSFEDGLIFPGKADIRINYQEWTGFPNTKLWSGWSRSGDKFIESRIDALPKWLSLLPICSDFMTRPESETTAAQDAIGLFRRDHAKNNPALNAEDRFFQIDYFKSQILTDSVAQEPQMKQGKKTEIKKAGPHQHAGLDEAFNLLEKVAAEGLSEEYPENEPADTVSQTPPPEKPEDEADILEKAREAWNYFSVGKPEDGIRVYQVLLRSNSRNDLIREDIKKLIILFPEYQELPKLFNDKE